MRRTDAVGVLRLRGLLLRLVVLIAPLVLLLLLVHLHLRQHQRIAGGTGARVVRRELRKRVAMRTARGTSESLHSRTRQTGQVRPAQTKRRKARRVRWRRVERPPQPLVAEGPRQLPAVAQRHLAIAPQAQQQLRSKTW